MNINSLPSSTGQKNNSRIVNKALLKSQNTISSSKKNNLSTNGKYSTDTENFISEMDVESKKDFQNDIFFIYLKSPSEYVRELFKKYNEEKYLCNYLLFEKSINLNMNINEKKFKNILIIDYLKIFEEVGCLCLNVSLINKKGDIEYNAFSPTLSSMILLFKTKKIIPENVNKKYIKKNFTVYLLPDGYIKIDFDEESPPFNRESIDLKIKIIHQIIGKKRLTLDNIDKVKSYFSILWTPSDSQKIGTSFLSFYSFDFKLIGILMDQKDEHNWLTPICINQEDKNIRDFKQYYINNVNIVKNFIKNCEQNNNISKHFFSHDYKHYLFNT